MFLNGRSGYDRLMAWPKACFCCTVVEKKKEKNHLSKKTQPEKEEQKTNIAQNDQDQCSCIGWLHASVCVRACFVQNSFLDLCLI